MPQSSAPPEPAFVATYWTLAGNVVPLGAPELEASPHDFIERVETAAALGYRGLGLIHSDLQRAVSRHGAATMRALLETHELDLEVEFLVGWLEDGAAAAGAEQVFSDLLNAADQIGARRIKVGPDMQARAWPLEHMCERFARLCERASAVGAGVVIEPMPWSNITELDTARALIEGAGAPNGGLLIDIWHMARGGVPYEAVAALPLGIIHHVELDDADAEIRGSLLEDTLNHRRFCGAGALDVPAFIPALDRQGYRGPYGIEIISERERQRPFEDVARDAISSARDQFVLARGSFSEN